MYDSKQMTEALYKIGRIGVKQEMIEQLREQAIADKILRIVVGAVIHNDKSEVLTVKRAANEKFLPGLCELPSGKVDLGEDYLPALIREIKEETGMDVRSVDHYIGHFDYTSGSGKATRQLNFIVTPKNYIVKLNPEEHSEYQWVNMKDKEKFAELGVTPNVIDIISQGYELISQSSQKQL